jgi:hypothetical protein
VPIALPLELSRTPPRRTRSPAASSWHVPCACHEREAPFFFIRPRPKRPGRILTARRPGGAGGGLSIRPCLSQPDQGKVAVALAAPLSCATISPLLGKIVKLIILIMHKYKQLTQCGGYPPHSPQHMPRAEPWTRAGGLCVRAGFVSRSRKVGGNLRRLRRPGPGLSPGPRPADYVSALDSSAEAGRSAEI